MISTRLTGDDIHRMTKSVFIDGPLDGAPSTKFWALLVLSGVIATAGVIADSVATVIGAMIVAPLMTPILGIALAGVLADRHRIIRSALFVLGGALAVISLAFLISIVFSPPNDYVTNGQVAGRISPSLIDLLAALATGLVGAFALVRSDISDTLPGVAIAISLVPPLAVTGMLLQVGRYGDAGQSLLLFGTNVAAIIATGTVVLLFYRVRGVAQDSGVTVGAFRRGRLVVVLGAVVAVAVPLSVGTVTIARDQLVQATLTPAAESWADAVGWSVSEVSVRSGTATVFAVGPRPEPDATPLRVALDDAGYADIELTVITTDGQEQVCPANSGTCGSEALAPSAVATSGG